MGSTLAPPTPAELASTAAPPPGQPQHMRALDEANRIRLARAALKRRLAEQPTRGAACEMCAELVADPPEVITSMTVIDLLTACRRMGVRAVEKVLGAAHVGERKPVGELTPAQRQRLIAALGMCA